MVKLFTLDRVQSKAGQFDLKKFAWMNERYLQARPIEEWRSRFREVFPAATDTAYLDRVIELMKPRIKGWRDVPSAIYFFSDDYPMDAEAVAKRIKAPGATDILAASLASFSSLPTFDATATEAAVRSLAESKGLKPADLIHPIRVATSGVQGGPSLFHMLEVLGRERVLLRMDKARSA
jgi:glutamyl-tRNA synthetase